MDHKKFENIIVVSQLYDTSKYEGVADHIEVLNIPHRMGAKHILSAYAVRKLIKKYSPDIVYAHSSIAGAITRLAHVGLSSKCVYNPHGWSFNMQSKMRSVFVCLEQVMAFFCDQIICISESEKQSALDKKIGISKLSVIYNGIETGRKPNKTRKELGLPEDAYIVGMVGRICKQKAPDTFIKMAESLKDVCFVIVGDVLEGASEERQEIEDLANKYGAKLIITGWVNNALDYIGAFDVACLFSRWEGFGLVLPEYMLCQKPVVATKVDAIPYLIKNEYNGLLVDVDDYQSAAKAIYRIRSDSALRDKLVRNGLDEVCTKYDVKRVSKEHEQLFSRLLTK